jgi:hypothetical protein
MFRLHMPRRTSSKPTTKQHPPQPAMLARGVWRAPWLGPNGELVLLIITHAHRLHGQPVIIPNGADEGANIRRLTGELNRIDPPSPIKVM